MQKKWVNNIVPILQNISNLIFWRSNQRKDYMLLHPLFEMFTLCLPRNGKRLANH